jgi:hypothetical protein
MTIFLHRPRANPAPAGSTPAPHRPGRAGADTSSGRVRAHRARRRLLSAAIGVVLTVPSFAGAATAGGPSAPTETASVVSDWNAIAVTTVLGDTSQPIQGGFVYLGFVHAAIYDAVVGVHGRYEPYRFHGRARHGTSATAAAAAAGHKILETYYPYAQSTLDADLAASLAAIPDGTAKTNGVAFGERVAQNLIDLRVNDGRNAPVEFTEPPAPGVWRPTPPAFAPFAAPWLGGVTPLLARSATQFAPPPPALTSARYTRDFAEVKALGSVNSTARTAEQTATALFFSGNALVQFAAAARDQAATRALDIVDAARMFAAVTMTMCDALIIAWWAKLVYGFWRPITAIQLADTDGNPATAADPAWAPLLTTPPYPDYVSGYNVIAGSASRAFEDLFGARRLNLTLTSTAVPGATRHYDSGRVLRSDVVDARVWLGIHFRFADTAARTIGVDLADWALDHYFRPVRHYH